MNVFESITEGLNEAMEYERGNVKARTTALELLDDGTVVRRDTDDTKPEKDAPEDKTLLTKR